MNSRLHQEVAAVVVALLVLAACSGEPHLPGLPERPSEQFTSLVSKQLEEAFDHVSSAARDPEANGRLGMILHTYERFEEAESCYRRACLLDPDSFDWTYYLAVVEFELGKQEEAIATLRRALSLDSDYLPARLRLADLLLAADLPAESRAQYESVLRNDPDSAIAHYGLGRILSADGQWEKAIAHLEEACQRFPQFGAAHYTLALCYRSTGYSEVAARHLDFYTKYKGQAPSPEDPLLQEIRQMNQSAQARVIEAERFVSQGLIPEALFEYQKAAELEPSNVAIHNSLIGVWWDLGNYEKAEEHYRTALRLTEESVKTHFNYGLVLFSQERYREAEASFRRALTINPRDASALHQLGFTLERLGDNTGAISSYELALAQNPNHRQVQFLLGRQLARRGQYADSIRLIEKTIGPRDSVTPWYMRALAAVHSQSGGFERANHYIREARSLAGEFGETKLVSQLDQDALNLEQRRAIE